MRCSDAHFENNFPSHLQFDRIPGGCFTNVSRALQNILSKFVYFKIPSSYENFNLKFYTCAQSHTLDTRVKFRHEILTINVITGSVNFREIDFESSPNVSETTPWSSNGCNNMKWTYIDIFILRFTFFITQDKTLVKWAPGHHMKRAKYSC